MRSLALLLGIVFASSFVTCTARLTVTRVPIIELIRLALKSDTAAITFNVMLLVNFFAALTGCLTSASRQGYALARDGGLFFKKR